MRSDRIDIRSIVAAEGGSQLVLMEHAQLQQSINNKTSKTTLLTLMLGDTPEAPSTKSALPERKGPESHQISLNTLEVALTLVEELLLDYTLATDDLYKSLNNKTCRIARCFMINDRSLLCLKLSYNILC